MSDQNKMSLDLLIKKAPKPKKGEKKEDYVSRAISFFVGEGYEQEQASAMAYQQWEDRGKKKTKKDQSEFTKSIPMDMSFYDIMDAIRTAVRKTITDSLSQGKVLYPEFYVDLIDVYLDGTCIVSIQGPNLESGYYSYDYEFASFGEVLVSNPVEVEKDWVEVEEIDKAKWTNAYMNDLPDSAFAYVESGGEKDEEGKTKPRTLRHFPYKDKNGKVDLPHLRNALARVSQASLSEDVKNKIKRKLQRLARQNGVAVTEKMEGKLNKGVLIKIDEQKQLVYGIVLAPEEFDAQDDIIDEEEIEKSAHNFMISYRNQISQMGEMHRKATPHGIVVENYVAPDDFEIGDFAVTKGSWVMVTKITKKSLWKKFLDGEKSI